MSESAIQPEAVLRELLGRARQEIFVRRLATGAARGLGVGVVAGMILAMAALILSGINAVWPMLSIRSGDYLAAVPILAFGVAFCGMLIGMLVQIRMKPTFAETAERLDQALQNDNRIATALDLCGRTEKTLLAAAAIEDGISQVKAATHARPVVPAVAWQIKRLVACGLVTLALAVIAALVGRISVAPEQPTLAAKVADKTLTAPGLVENRMQQDAVKPSAESKSGREQGQGKAGALAGRSPENHEKGKAGAAGASDAGGKADGMSQASAASASSGGRAAASETARRSDKNRAAKTAKSQVAQGDGSQSPGKGGASGQSGSGGKMQNVSQGGLEQAVQDASARDELDGDLHDAEENKDSAHHGSAQPMPPDRQASPSRELGLPGNKGLGGTGRGGPTPQKKSRGTASMVLGTTTPDFVPGQMRPGPGRITSEMVPPEKGGGASEASAVKEAGVGSELQQERYDPDAALGDALGEYFRALHAQDAESRK